MLPRRVLVLGATGTIGRASVGALKQAGHEVVCLVRNGAARDAPSGATIRYGDVTDAGSVLRDGIRGEHFDVIVSCLASRNGTPRDAWAIDHQANLDALGAALTAGVPHFILVSAICVQKPMLAFQHAKLAFEAALTGSGLTYSIVRPTAFFKSLSGQVQRVKDGKAFLVFGDGALTACKPISDDDLGAYVADCVTDETRWNSILPVGGPGAAITPKEQGEMLFALLGKPARFKHVPLRILDIVIATLTGLGALSQRIADKAELARIGRYYATESMLVRDPITGRYDADATPSTGTRTLRDHYTAVIAGDARDDRGDHAVF